MVPDSDVEENKDSDETQNKPSGVSLTHFLAAVRATFILQVLIYKLELDCCVIGNILISCICFRILEKVAFSPYKKSEQKLFPSKQGAISKVSLRGLKQLFF